MSPRGRGTPRGWARGGLAGALVVGAVLACPEARAREWTARSGAVEVVVHDPPWALRAPAVARWLARELDAILPPEGTYRLEVARRRLDEVPATLEDGVLVLDTAQPLPSLDERLQVLTWAAYGALLPGRDPTAAWALAGEMARARYPEGRWPAFLPHCCPGEDALLASGGPGAPPAGVEDGPVGPAWHLEVFGGVAWPPLESWPWAVGLASLSVPVGRWAVAGALEVWPSDMLEARAGGGLYLGLDPWSRVEAGPLVAWRPRGTAFPVDGAPEEAGAWARFRGFGFDVLGRAVHAPSEGGGAAVFEAVARGRWEVPLGSRLVLIPGVAGAALAGEDAFRRPTLGALPGGVRWLSMGQDPADLVAAARLDAEAWLPAGRSVGPPALRPRTIVLRAGGDLGWSPPTGWVPGLAAAVGLSANPWREYRGTVFVQASAPVDLSDVDLSVWLSLRVR